MKPENVVVGSELNSKNVYLIDFGISKFYIDKNGKHIKFQTDKPFIGTARYAYLSYISILKLW